MKIKDMIHLALNQHKRRTIECPVTDDVAQKKYTVIRMDGEFIDNSIVIDRQTAGKLFRVLSAAHMRAYNAGKNGDNSGHAKAIDRTHEAVKSVLNIRTQSKRERQEKGRR